MSSDDQKFKTRVRSDAKSDLHRIFKNGGAVAPVPVAKAQTQITPVSKNSNPPYVPQVDAALAEAKTKTTIAPNLDLTPQKILRPVARKTDHTAWLLIFPALALMAYALTASVSETAHVPSVQVSRSMTDAELNERVELHRNLTGWKLNRERASVETTNQLSAPALPADIVKVRPPDIMSGVPLQAESNSRRDEKIVPVNPDYPDARVMYSLQEEQDKNEWDRRVQAQYVKEFIANAERAGYKLKVNSDGQITIISYPKNPPVDARMPGSAR